MPPSIENVQALETLLSDPPDYVVETMRQLEGDLLILGVGGKMGPLKFEDTINPTTQRMRPRLVDVDSETYECARRYMIRLEAEDFASADKTALLAAAAKLTPDQFRQRFEGLA